jgi:Ser/Thr protein kinase RdoA (MazF antagonist)
MEPAPDAGLINTTLLLGDPPRYVLQRVNPIFDPAVQEDIAAVTARLARGGLVTPRLVPTDAGGLWESDDEGGVWRLLTFVPGRTLHKVGSLRIAAEAAGLVARFHRALDGFEWTYWSVRAGAHDTPTHLARLEAVLAPGDAEPAAVDILEAWRAWDGRLDLPDRHCHGDLKISNIRFSMDGEAICLVDLDTLSLLPVDVELGDAFRSWCNPVGEDSVDTCFDVEVFTAAARAYLAANPLPADQRAALIPGVERIAIELASRFCRDVYEDRYFGWDPRRFPSRAAHNLFRARGQLALARSVRARRAEAERALAG